LIVIIIQARMDSLRLPGKIMKEINGKPLLFYVINQLKNCLESSKIVIATSNTSKDKIVSTYVENLGILSFRGNENDVLDRYYRCAKNFSATEIIRISADSPLIDCNIIQKCKDEFYKKNADYVSNTISIQHNKVYRNFNGYPQGQAVEIFSFNVLKKAWKESKNEFEREHVTPYIWNNPSIFKLSNIKNDTDMSKARLVVDYKEDFELVKKIIEEFPKDHIFSLEEIIDFLNKHPNLYEINSKYEH